MRVAFVIALSAIAFAASVPVRAADLAIGHFTSAPALAARAGVVVIYDDQPGIVLRRYWLTPWHNHHYFPTRADLRKTRRSDKNCDYGPPKPAESYERSWSTSSNFMSDAPSVQMHWIEPDRPARRPDAAQP